MLAHSPKDRSRSPHRTNGNQNDTSTQNDAHTTNNKSKKENESQIRLKTLKVIFKKKQLNIFYLFFFQSFIQTLINDPSSLGSTYDEQVKAVENACVKEFHDLSLDRIRRMIRSIFKVSQNLFIYFDYSQFI
jgi:hypothetical protein